MRKLFLIISFISLFSFFRPSTAQNGSSYFFVNLAPATESGLDLYVNGQLAIRGNVVSTLSGERFLDAGSYEITIYPKDAAPDTALAELTVEFTAGQRLLIVAYAKPEGLALTTYQPDRNSIPANLSRLQIIHLGKGLPSLTLTAQNEDVLVENLAYESELNQSIPGGNYQVVFNDPDGNKVGEASIGAVSGSLAFVIVYGDTSPRTFQLNESLQQKAYFRFVHAGRISPAVDVYLNDQLIFSEIEYAGSTDYTAVDPSENYTVSLYETGTDTPLWTGAISLTTGFPVTGVALGEANFRMITYIDDLQQLPLGRARIRFIHAALNSVALTITDEKNTIIQGGLQFTTGSNNQNVETGIKTFIFKETEGVVYDSLEAYEINAGTVYTFVLAGNALVEGEVQVIPLTWNWKANPPAAEE